MSKGGQHFLGVIEVEEIDGSRVLAIDKADLQFPHEPSRRHPKIIPHQDNALNPPAIALTQGWHQLRTSFLFLGVQPLFELVQDDQQLLADRNTLAPAKCRQRLY